MTRTYPIKTDFAAKVDYEIGSGALTGAFSYFSFFPPFFDKRTALV